MSLLKTKDLINILPKDGPSVEEVKKYLDKYHNEFIVIKCGGGVLINQELFNIFIQDISTLKKLGLSPIIVHGGGKRINNKLIVGGDSYVSTTFKTLLHKLDEVLADLFSIVNCDFLRFMIDSLADADIELLAHQLS